MLRRSKARVEDQLALPRCIHEDKRVTMSSTQRNIYEHLASEFRLALNTLRNHQRYIAGNQAGQQHIRGPGCSSKVMSMLTSLRQICCDPALVHHRVAVRTAINVKASLRETLGRLVIQVRFFMAHLHAWRLTVYPWSPTQAQYSTADVFVCFGGMLWLVSRAALHSTCAALCCCVVPQFYNAFDTNHATLCSERILKVFAQLLDHEDVEGDMDQVYAQLAQVQACLQLADMYDVRQAVRRRTKEGEPNMVLDAADKVQ